MRYVYVAAGWALPLAAPADAAALLGQGGRRDPGHRADGRRLPAAAGLRVPGRAGGRAGAAAGVVRPGHRVAVAASGAAPPPPGRSPSPPWPPLWIALAPPRVVDGLAPGDFARIPLEGLALVGLAVVLPARPRRVLAIVLGRCWRRCWPCCARSASASTSTWTGRSTCWATGRCCPRATRSSATPRAASWRSGWSSVRWRSRSGWPPGWSGPHSGSAAPQRTTRAPPSRRSPPSVPPGRCSPCSAARPGQLAASGSAGLVVDTVEQVRDDYQDIDVFEEEIEDDAFADTPADELLTGLRGKDVLLVLVRELRPGGPGGIVVRTGYRRGAAGGRRRAGRGRLPHQQRLPDLAHLRSRQLAGPRDPAVGGLGGQRAAVRPAARERSTDPHRRVRACGLAHRVLGAGEHPRLARGGGVLRLRPALRLSQRRVRRARSSGTPRCRTSTRWSTSSAPSSPPRTVRRSSPRSTWSPATTRGRRCPSRCRGPRSATGRSSTGCPSGDEASVDGDEDPSTAQHLYGESVEYTWRILVSSSSPAIPIPTGC